MSELLVSCSRTWRSVGMAWLLRRVREDLRLIVEASAGMKQRGCRGWAFIAERLLCRAAQ